MAEVLGRTIHLSDGRLVFFGTSAETPESYYLGFRNAEGDDKKLILSREAKDALAILLKDPMAGMPLKDFPHKMQWRKVEYSDRPTPN